MTDRYVRRGGPIPQIYPGTLDGINQALKDMASTSRFLPDRVIYLAAVEAGVSTIIRTFKGGHSCGSFTSPLPS